MKGKRRTEYYNIAAMKHVLKQYTGYSIPYENSCPPGSEIRHEREGGVGFDRTGL